MEAIERPLYRLVRLKQFDVRHYGPIFCPVWAMDPKNFYDEWKYGYICSLCTEPTLVERSSLREHVSTQHKEWLNAIGISIRHTPAPQKNRYLQIKSWFERNLPSFSREGMLTQNVKEWFYGYKCRRCKYHDYSYLDVVEHFQRTHLAEAEKSIEYELRPWKDPESLFCSPNLGVIIGKKPAKGEECRGPQKNET